MRELISDIAVLEETAEAVLRVRSEVVQRLAELHRQVLAVAKSDPVCCRLMSVPGVGPVTALAYRTAVEDPRRAQFAVARRLAVILHRLWTDGTEFQTSRNGIFEGAVA